MKSQTERMIGMGILPMGVTKHLLSDFARPIGVALMPQSPRPEAAHRDTGVRGNLKIKHTMLLGLVELGSLLRLRKCCAVISDHGQRLRHDLVARYQDSSVRARLGE